MSKGSLNVSLKGADDIFSTEESRQEQQREQVQQIPIGELFPFKNHPFKVLDDESMQRTVESVEQYGVLSPLIARPRPEGGYEIISGHRRQHAAQLAGLDALPATTMKPLNAISKFENYFLIRTVSFQVHLEAGGYFLLRRFLRFHLQQAGIQHKNTLVPHLNGR